MHKISKRKALDALQHWTQYPSRQSIAGAILISTVNKEWVADQLEAGAKPFRGKLVDNMLILKHPDGIVTYILLKEQS